MLRAIRYMLNRRVVAEPRKLPIKPINKHPRQIFRVFFEFIEIWVDELITPSSRSFRRRIVSIVIEMRARA